MSQQLVAGPERLFAASIGYAVRRLHQALRAEMEERLRPFGLTSAQFACLSVVDRLPGVSNAGLARVLAVTPQTSVRIIQGLEQAGLLARVPHPAHGRLRETRLTDEGSRLLRRAEPAVRAAEERVLAGLSRPGRAELLRLVWHCADNVRTDRPVTDW